jgi:hypothetical protein
VKNSHCIHQRIFCFYSSFGNQDRHIFYAMEIASDTKVNGPGDRYCRLFDQDVFCILKFGNGVFLAGLVGEIAPAYQDARTLLFGDGGMTWTVVEILKETENRSPKRNF